MVAIKKELKINVYETNAECDLPTKAIDFMAFWDEKLSLIPKEFRANAQIEVEATTSYDYALLEVVVSYTRVETDDEKTCRELNEQARVYNFEQRRQSEKKKYDTQPPPRPKNWRT